LISYLVDAFTNENSIVLDSFAGSGTTAHAVLNLNLGQNTKRKFILIENKPGHSNFGDYPRIKAVIDGSEVAEIQATGGGFRFYRLGSPIFDEQGHIHPSIRFDHLAAHILVCGDAYATDSQTQALTPLGNHNENCLLPALQRHPRRQAPRWRQRPHPQNPLRAPRPQRPQGHLRRKLAAERGHAQATRHCIQTNPLRRKGAITWTPAQRLPKTHPRKLGKFLGEVRLHGDASLAFCQRKPRNGTAFCRSIAQCRG